tara:strand:- start:6207 stop:6827 length:621 start_codon:yes stop_codon:yes gene_type:complete
MIKDLPTIIPVFPLSGVIYFPKTNLPLNIFEQRYLDLVNDAYRKNKYMGMIQAKNDDNEIFNVGCLGKISDYQESEDGRVLINLTGISRFKITKEISNKKLYREFQVEYKSFIEDDDNKSKKIDTENLISKSKIFFKKNGLLINWREFERLDELQKINTLAMIAPITNQEKQKLLEAITLDNKINVLESIISFYLYENGINNHTIQ